MRHDFAVIYGQPRVTQIQREDMASLLRDARTPAKRIDGLRAMVLRRKINQLSVVTFEPGRQVVDGQKDEAASRAEGLHRQLSEMFMEALYAIERKAMSLRLNQYQQTRHR